jgi:protein TonB
MNRVGSTGVQGFFAALIIHGAGFGFLFLIPPPEKSKASVRPPVKVRVAQRPDPPPPPVEDTPKPEVKEPIEVKPDKPLKKRVASVKKTQAPKPAAPAPAASPAPAAPAPTPNTPRKFTVAMEATVPGGGVAVPASEGGGWTFGAPDGDVEGEKKLAGPAPEPPKEEKKGPPPPRDAAGVTRLPKLISQPSSLDMRAAYPEAARRENREANVYLKILVTADGKVDRVRVMRGAGEGFDRAAVKLVKQFRFRPAEADGQAVSVWIPWTYKFRLEG